MSVVGDRVLRFGGLTFQPSSGALVRDGIVVPLGGRARELLSALLERPGRVISHVELTQRVWPGGGGTDANLRMQVSALRRALGPAEDGTDVVINIPGRGYQFVLPLLPDVPPVAFPGTQQDALPPPLHQLIGRDRELAELAGKFNARCWITLTGPGGVGKSSLAAEAARAWVAIAPERRACYADLSSLVDPALLPAALEAALGAATVGAGAGSGLLLLLDNADRLAGTGAAVFGALRAHYPELLLVVTSRRPFGTLGESPYRVLPLAVAQEGTEQNDVQRVLSTPSASLFVQRAASHASGFELSDADAPALARLCRDLDGLPLALVLAAARVGMFGIAGLAAGMGNVASTAGAARRGAAARHRTLSAVLDESHDTLSEADRQLFRSLSVLHGAFGQRDAAAVANLTEADAQAGLRRLEAGSLLEPGQEGTGGSRWSMLRTTWGYAAARLSASGEGNAVHGRQIGRLLRLIETMGFDWEGAGPVGAEGRGTGVGVRPEVPSSLPEELRAAIDWGLRPGGDRDAGLRLLLQSRRLWQRLDRAAELRERLDLALRVLTDAGEGEGEIALQIHAALGAAVLDKTGELPVMAGHFAQAQDIALRTGAVLLALHALCGQWMAQVLAGNLATARDLCDEYALQLGPEAPADSLYRLVLHRMAGLTLCHVGDMTGAWQHLHAALAHPGRHTDLTPIGMINDTQTALHALRARLCWLSGRPTEAWEASTMSLDAADAAEHPSSVCFALVQAVCPVAIWTGRTDAAMFVARLADVADTHRRPHWQSWAHVFAAALSNDAGSLLEGDYSPYQLATLVTLRPGLAEAAMLTRAEAAGAGWCAPELRRARAEALLARSRHEPGALRAAERMLEDACRTARDAGLRAWEERCQGSLVKLRQGAHAGAGVTMLAAGNR